MKRQSFLLLVGVLWLLSIGHASASTYNIQVGAVGDQGSIGSLGVRAEIRMHAYTVTAPDLVDSFWIASNLKNGGGIQFGYSLPAAGTYCTSGQIEPGTSFACTSGSLAFNGSQPNWFWQYSPNTKLSSNLYYFGLGTAGLATSNGTWHSFAIMPDSQRGWAFLLDGHEVANAGFPTVASSSGGFSVAEKVTLSTSPGPLGPVEFRNLAYLKEDGWHNVTTLYAIVNCGVNPNCIPIPYGVSLLGPNHIIAGTSIPQPKDGELLWSLTAQSAQTTPIMSTTSTLTIVIRIMPELLLGGLAVAALGILLVFEFVVLPRRKHTKKRR